MPSSLRLLRRALYATAIGAAIIAAVAAASDEAASPDVVDANVISDATRGDAEEEASIDIRPPDAPRPPTRRRTIRRKKQKIPAPLTQKFDNFQQTYNADGDVVTSGDADKEAEASTQGKDDAAPGEQQEDEYEDVEVEVDENGNEIDADAPPRVPHHIPPFDQEAHDRRNREHQEMADRHHAELTADMEVRRAEFEKRHAAHMERINTHILGRHRERMAEHTARLSASLAAPHSRSFVPPLSASRSRSADELATAEGGDNAAASPAGFLGSDIEAHIQAMHEQIRRQTAEHRARIHAEMDRVHQEIRQMSGSLREEGEAAVSASNAIEAPERSTVDDTSE